MKKGWKRFAALLLCMMMALPVFAFAEEETEAAPNVSEILKQYTKLDLTPYLGKTVLLNFFTEWCPYCMQEMPAIKELANIYDEEAFQIVMIHPWDREDASNTENVKTKFGMEDMVFFEDEDTLVTYLLGVPGYPTTVFLNPDGTVGGAAPYGLTLEQFQQQLDHMGVPRKAAEE